ncbi:MAG: site-specific integrase [Caenibius sp.]
MPRPNRGPRLHWIAERGTFYIIWYDRGAKRLRSTGTADRREAEKSLVAFIGASHRLSGKNEPQDILVTDALDHYGKYHAPTRADPARIGYAIDALISYWTGKTLADITPRTCAAYTKERGIAPGTARRELSTLTAAQSFLLREGLLTSVTPATLPDKPEPKDRWITRQEAARLLWAARKGGRQARLYLPLFILIALHTGARKEAILSLRWSQVDLQGGRINYAIPGRARTKKRRPHIPIPRRLMPHLKRAWIRRSDDNGTVLHLDGQPLQRIDKGFRAAVKRAGLEGVTPHTLRHTRGTWLAQAGVPLWEIAGFLGQDQETTARIYAHHHPDYMRAAMDAVG